MFYFFRASKKTLTFVLFILFLNCIDVNAQGDSIVINRVEVKPDGDTVSVFFRLMRDGRKVFHPGWLDEAETKFIVKEEGFDDKYLSKVCKITDIRDCKDKNLSDNLSILLLIDRSFTVSEDLIHEQAKVVVNIINELKDVKIYISYMDHGGVSPAKRITVDSWDGREDQQFTPISDKYTGGGEKHLYRAILSKLQEFSGMSQTDETYPNTNTNENEFKNDGRDKIMFVFTDGKVYNEKTQEFYGGSTSWYTCQNKFYQLRDSVGCDAMRKIPIHCIYVGKEEDLDKKLEGFLSDLCYSNNNEYRGKLYKNNITPDTLQQLMIGIIDSTLNADYRLDLLNPKGKKYDGSEKAILLGRIIPGSDTLWSNKKQYVAGNSVSPIIVGAETGGNLVVGFLIGILLLATVYYVLQFLIPQIRYKDFLKKYVHPFHAGSGDTVSQTCYFCKAPLEEGEIVVTKCQHVVHKECWDENRNRCPEYGHGCKTGIHYYNQEKKSDPQNASHYTPWIVYGLAAGLLAWMCFTILNGSNLFQSLMGKITEALYPSFESLSEDGKLEVVDAMTGKTSVWLLNGITLGFFIVLAFCTILDYRKKTTGIILKQVLRALVGAVGGGLAFFLGSIAIIALGKYSTCWYVDWIPWLLFSLTMGVVLWYKTEIKLSSALLGGALSIIFSFLVIVLLRHPVASMLSYMLYAAGLGVSIAVVHFVSQKYFLRVDGCIKERDIAIYKWMSVTGGFNKVSIGRSPNCVLQMDWDDSDSISDRAVELYLENERPYLRVLDSGVSQQGRTIPKGIVISLQDGTEFSIGKTRFTYIEKDR